MNRRCLALLWALGSLLLAGCPRDQSARLRLSLDARWAFHRGDAPGAEAPGFDDRTWSRVDLPHDWSVEQPFDPKAPGGGPVGYLATGVGWYRQTLPDSIPAGRMIEVVFDGAAMNARVWINGHDLGIHPYAYTPFRFDLTPWLDPRGPNVLAVRVDNSKQPDSRWYSGSGLYRHVWLEATGPLRIAPGGAFFTTRSLGPDTATVRAEITLENRADAAREVQIAAELTAPDGGKAASVGGRLSVPARGSATWSADFEVAHPEAWSPDSPSLYRADVRVESGSDVVDGLSQIVGLRTVRVSADRGFELNGRPLKLAGGSVHADNGVLGTAAFDRAEVRRVELLKAAGFNAVRTAHNPPSPAFLDACDRLGLLVMDEAFDCWEQGKNPYDYGIYFRDWWKKDLDAMVLRDRNHPSIVFWSIGNEVYERGNANGYRIARMLTARIRELDDSRPLTAAINNLGAHGDWTRVDPIFASLDVAGYNYQILRAEADHARFPRRVIVATESEPINAFLYWSSVQDHPYVIGEFVWSAMDYLGEAGIGRVFPPDVKAYPHWKGEQWPWHGAVCGDIDLTGWRRPVSHYRAILWDRGEKLYACVLAPAPGGGSWNLSQWAMPPALPSWTWPGKEGQSLTVEVYSRYDAVRLYRNGRLVGEKPTNRATAFTADFAVPYAPGELRAVGLRAGRPGESFVLTTAGAPARLRLTADRTQLRADGEDLSFVTVEAVDSAGTPVPTASIKVRLSLTGPATLAGYGTADMTTLEPYGANPRSLYQGRALAVIRSGRETGPVRLVAEASGVEAADLSLATGP